MAMLGGWRLTRMGVIFVIGIVVLAGLVTGAVFLVRGRGEQVRRDEAVKVAEQNLKEESDGVVTPPNESSNATEAAQKEADAKAKAEADAAARDAAQRNNVASNSPSALPETGAAEDFGRILSVTILATSVAFYVASRRAAQRG